MSWFMELVKSRGEYGASNFHSKSSLYTTHRAFHDRNTHLNISLGQAFVGGGISDFGTS
jgi:hypothetical protein